MRYSSLKTTVRNLTDHAVFFGFLGSHGKLLDSMEEYTEDGDLIAKLTTNRRFRRAFNSFQTALTSGTLALVSTPKDHHYDETVDATKVIKIDNGVVSGEDASWGGYSSSQS